MFSIQDLSKQLLQDIEKWDCWSHLLSVRENWKHEQIYCTRVMSWVDIVRYYIIDLKVWCDHGEHSDYGQHGLHQQYSAQSDRLAAIRQSLAVIDASLEQVTIFSLVYQTLITGLLFSFLSRTCMSSQAWSIRWRMTSFRTSGTLITTMEGEVLTDSYLSFILSP